jgi:hypothetical protein
MQAASALLAFVSLQVLAVLLFRALASWNARIHPEPDLPGGSAAGPGEAGLLDPRAS